jgi:glycosyltransferase involved in cell wall biosynthesis
MTGAPVPMGAAVLDAPAAPRPTTEARSRRARARPRRMLVLCPYPQDRAPSQRLKFEQYYDDWRAHGWTVDVRPFWDAAGWNVLYRPGHRVDKAAALARGLVRRRRDLDDALRADLVYLHHEAAPVGPPWIERRIARAGVPIVYDVDDLVHLPHGSRANPFMRLVRGRGPGPGKVPELIGLARQVIVCTPYLAEYARGFQPRVTNISSTIDTDAYRPRPASDRTDGIVIGWSGSHSTSPYLHLLDDVLRDLQRELGVRVLVIGDGGFATEGLRLEARPWRLDCEVADLRELDVGVYPLPHEEWVLGKSGLKALQYMALAIPPVVEHVGVNPEIVRDGENGFLARGAEEWRAKLRLLIRDPALRDRLGRAARRTVEEHYSVRANAPRYRQVLEDALGG